MARKKSIKIPKKYKDYVDLMKDDLEKSGVIVSPFDEKLIDEIAFNLFIIDECKISISNEGVKENVVRDETKKPLYQKNQSLSIYNEALKNLSTLHSKLGVSLNQRLKLLYDKNDDKEDIEDYLS